jgi:two-component system, OmpR family, sensor kinase
MNFIRRSLFLQFYATILMGLALVALVFVAFAAIGKFDQRDPLAARLGPFLDSVLPPPGENFNLERAVHRMAETVNADISVYDRQGTLIANAGRPVPPDVTDDDPKGFRPPGRTFAFETPDGLKVVARSRRPFGPHRQNVAFIILLIAAALGLAALPVTRRLTRRLEKLKTGMDTWSAGALETRLTVEGNDEIADVARTFNMAAGRIEDLVTAQKNLLANASHELRSPLARLRMAIEMFEADPGEGLKTEIVRNMAELDELVEEILISSRLQAGRTESFEDMVDLVAIAAEESTHFDAVQAVTVTGPSTLIRANGRLIRRLIRNLLQNAARHGKPPIEVSVTETAEALHLTVTDHGDGIPESERERIFEPFYRPAGRAEAAGGWGIGLALVRQIAELQGGSVRCEAADGGGAAFVVRLPRTAGQNKTG